MPNAKIFSHKIHYRISDGYAVVRPEEACNEETTEALAHLASSNLIDSKHLVLDLSHSKYVATPGYRWILRRLKELESSGKSLTLVGLSPTVERTFKLLRLDESIPTAKTVPEAIAMIRCQKAAALV